MEETSCKGDWIMGSKDLGRNAAGNRYDDLEVGETSREVQRTLGQKIVIPCDVIQ